MSTVVEVECISKKHSKNWDTKNPISYNIELSVPYDQNSIYYQLSGGTGINLNTINKDAADMFNLGDKYKIEISPV
jgi:hypothetical protein